MASQSICHTIAYLLLFLATALAQTVYPSNASDIGTAANTPQFIVSQAGQYAFPTFQIAALGPYAAIPRSQFITLMLEGRLVNTDANNANAVKHQDFSYISCDPADYADSNLDASATLKIVTNMRAENSVILYSTTANHCFVNGIDNLPNINGIFTTLDPVLAAQVADMNYTQAMNAYANIRADTTTDTNATSGWGSSGVPYAPSPTTAIAMIVLYSITGVITALFVVIIVSGAVRAHRHPERYGPRNGAGRSRQSRAKGIARAMLETLPIVKFGDHKDVPKTGATQDVELTAQDPTEEGSSRQSGEKKDATAVTTDAVADAGISSSAESSSSANPDGSDESGSLGCSICTEDFQKGEELRVLPCNHKFHPICVDPWLLDVSGTCPLCRIDLRPQSQIAEDESVLRDQSIAGAPPLANGSGSGQVSMIQNLRAAVSGSREERIAALRRFRHERQRYSIAQSLTGIDSEQPGLARRLRERFRVRTGRHGTAEVDSGENRSTGA